MEAKKAAKEEKQERPSCYGHWERKIDPMRRIGFPSEFRGVFGEEAVVVEIDGLKGFLLYPIERINEFEPSTLWIVRIDTRGKFSIPQRFGISSSSKGVWLGRGDHFEFSVS